MVNKKQHDSVYNGVILIRSNMTPITTKMRFNYIVSQMVHKKKYDTVHKKQHDFVKSRMTPFNRVSGSWYIRKLNPGDKVRHYWFRRGGTKTSSKSVILTIKSFRNPKKFLSQNHLEKSDIIGLDEVVQKLQVGRQNFVTPKNFSLKPLGKNIEQTLFRFHNF